MSRFYRGDDLVVDLDAVSCVAGDAIIVGGVRVVLREPVAAAIRKQFVLYKEMRDRNERNFKEIFQQRFAFVSLAAELIGRRLHGRLMAGGAIENGK